MAKRQNSAKKLEDGDGPGAVPLDQEELENLERVVETAEYIADLSEQMRGMALATRQSFLAHLLELVMIEAMETSRHKGDYKERLKRQAQAG